MYGTLMKSELLKWNVQNRSYTYVNNNVFKYPRLKIPFRHFNGEHEFYTVVTLNLYFGLFQFTFSFYFHKMGCCGKLWPQLKTILLKYGCGARNNKYIIFFAIIIEKNPYGCPWKVSAHLHLTQQIFSLLQKLRSKVTWKISNKHPMTLLQ